MWVVLFPCPHKMEFLDQTVSVFFSFLASQRLFSTFCIVRRVPLHYRTDAVPPAGVFFRYASPPMSPSSSLSREVFARLVRASGGRYGSCSRSDAVRDGVGVIGSVFTHREPTAGTLTCFGNAIGFARAEILPRVVTRDRKETPRRAFQMLQKDGAGRSVARCGCGTEIFLKLFAMSRSRAINRDDINRA